MHTVPTLHQSQRKCSRNGGFAHPPFAHDHDEPVARLRQGIGQRRQPGVAGHIGRGRRLRSGSARRGYAQQGP